MLKVTGSQMKITTKPSKAKVVAMPAGYSEQVKRWEEQAERARIYREGAAQRKAEQFANLQAANAIRFAKMREAREAEKRKPKRLWDNFEEVAVIQKNDTHRFSIAACTRDGFRCVLVREFYLRKRDNQWMPAKDGIMIPLMYPLGRSKKPDPDNPPKMIYPMQEFVSAMAQAIETARDMELANPDNAVWLNYYTPEELKNED